MHQVAFRVHSPFGVHAIGNGALCHLWYSTTPVGHYDVWTEEMPQGQQVPDPSVQAPQDPPPSFVEPSPPPVPIHHPSVRLPPSRLGGLTPHLVTTLNVGGSRTAIVHALHQPGMILLLQEHRHLGPGLQGLQLLARQAGWHGLWDPAVTSGDQGRSGGTAVLIRRPMQIHRGSTLDRCTHATVPWTRTQRLRIVSVCGPPARIHMRLKSGHTCTHSSRSSWLASGASRGSSAGIGTPPPPTSLLSGIGIVVLPILPSPLKSMDAT